ncbi:MAG: hypothetical protein FWC06_02360, partial [Treponema sp.]|nr:hypothetical protein [Treponema sp.]
EGKVTEVSGADTFTLKPNDESKPAITAKVSGTNTLTALTPDEGTVIVWDNGSQTTAPGAAIEPPTTQPSTPSGGAITVTNQQLYEYDWETDEFTASSKTGKAYNEYGFWDEEIGEYIIFDKIEIGTVTNGKISFKLQEAPPVSQLHDLAELWGEFGPNVTQTPNNAKAEFATLVFYDSDDNRHVFGCFSFSSSLDSHILYVDRNANITGVEIIEDEYYYEETWFNMNLKTGWNICYFIQDDDNEEIYKFTTTLPDGAGQLNWGYGVRP